MSDPCLHEVTSSSWQWPQDQAVYRFGAEAASAASPSATMLNSFAYAGAARHACRRLTPGASAGNSEPSTGEPHSPVQSDGTHRG